MRFVLATNNEHKRHEFTPLFAGLGLTPVLPRELNVPFAPKETGRTYEDNARIKAEAACRATGLPALADDSGLEVRALSGAPGVLSARFGAPEAVTDADRNAHLLRAMANETDRRARFVCVLVAVFPGGRSLMANGICEGEILKTPVGAGGFGYDPLFYLPALGKTMAELTRDEKNQLSHRAIAMKEFARLWEQAGLSAG